MNDQLKPHVDVRDKVFNAVIRQLDALGCTYHILCPWTGDEHGYPLAPQAEVIVTRRPVTPAEDEAMNEALSPSTPAPESPKKRVVDRQAGQERNRHILPYLLTLTIGEPVEIPTGPFTMDDIQGTVGARLARAFGDSGTYTTSRNNEKGVLQAIVMSNKLNPRMGEAEAIVKTFAGGPLALYAETCLEEFKSQMMKRKLQTLQQVVHEKHKTA